MAASSTVLALSQALKPAALLGGRLGKSARVSQVYMFYSDSGHFVVYYLVRCSTLASYSIDARSASPSDGTVLAIANYLTG